MIFMVVAMDAFVVPCLQTGILCNMSSVDDAETRLDEMDKVAQSLIKKLNTTLVKKKRKSKPKPKPKPATRVRWKQRDKDGNIVAQTSKSPSSNSCAKRVRTSTPSVPEGISVEMPDDQEEGLENALKELESLLSVSHDDTDDIIEASTPTTASDWKTRNIFSSERWKEARHQLMDNMLRANCIKPQLCQRCLKKDATIRCAECMPMQYYCCDCDISHHQSQALHNRASGIHGFHKPLPPTVVVKDDADGHYSHHTCVRILPMEIPDHICKCPPESLNVVPGRPIVFINMKGRYDLNLPELRCGSCCASWKPELSDVQVSGYWPATIHFYTLYDVAIFQGFKEMKLVAPGNSRLSFMRMLDAQTTECGRTGKVCSDTFYKSFMEWVICSYEVNKLCSEQPFICPACCPQMLAVSVDGNRKHYRFKKDGCTDEAGYFEGVLLCKDDEVAAFVEDIQRRTKHVPGKGVCGRSQLNAAKETSKRSSSSLDEQGIEVAVCRHGIILRALNMFRGEIFAYPMFLQKEVSAISPPTFFCMDVICKYWPYISRICEAYPEYHHLTAMKPFLSVLHAKAHGIKCEIKWGGGNQDGAGSTLGEEVERVNSFLSRTAINTKFMGKGARTDMLTVQIMDWNKRKVKNMCNTLCSSFHKTQRDLQRERQSLEAIKEDLSVNDETVQQWVTDVQDWAEHDSPAGSSDSLLEVRRRIEENSLGLRQRRARLYSHTDTNSGRSVIRSRMWRERNQLEVHVAQHDEMVQPQQQIGAVENLLTAGYIFPWLLPPSDGIDFLAKKKAFDKVMHVKRLEEEVKILATEVRQHWEFLKKREDDLSGLFTSIEGSHRSLSKEGLQGLQGELKRRLFHQRSQLASVRQKYLELIKAGLQGSMLDLVWGEEPEESEEQAISSAYESCSDEEDMDMQGLDSGQQIPEDDVVEP